MWRSLLIVILAALTSILQISFFSQLPFPFSALSFPVVAIAYGVARDRPLLAAGWALVAGALFDLHGLLGFGAEIAAFFAAFFVARFLFQRVVTNASLPAFFLLGAATAIAHWFALSAIDGAGVLFGGAPVMADASLATVLAPLRQGVVDGLALVLVIVIEDRLTRRFRKAFLSHAPHPFS